MEDLKIKLLFAIVSFPTVSDLRTDLMLEFSVNTSQLICVFICVPLQCTDLPVRAAGGV